MESGILSLTYTFVHELICRAFGSGRFGLVISLMVFSLFVLFSFCHLCERWTSRLNGGYGAPNGLNAWRLNAKCFFMVIFPLLCRRLRLFVESLILWHSGIHFTLFWPQIVIIYLWMCIISLSGVRWWTLFLTFQRISTIFFGVRFSSWLISEWTRRIWGRLKRILFSVTE